MGRRSDHSREELEELILSAGQDLMAQAGYAGFSARAVAKKIGYSVGTVVNMYDGVDGLVVRINSRTFGLWSNFLEASLAKSSGQERITKLVQGYFDFARENLNLWAAIYEHRLPLSAEMPACLAEERTRLTGIIVREIAAVLPLSAQSYSARLARSLIATVHGHCTFALNGNFAMLGETDPLGLAQARVLEILHANGAEI